MGDLPATRPSLLIRIRDGQDHQAWKQFVHVYGPLIYGFARNPGLQDADAADLMQETLRVVAGAVKTFEYDPQKGTFRAWLFTVVRHRLFRFRDRARQPDRPGGDSSLQDLLAEVPAPETSEAVLWDQEYERHQFAWAAEQVRPQVHETTWQAFWQSAVEGKGGKEVAASLHITVAAVYLAKSRVMARLKEQIAQIAGEY